MITNDYVFHVSQAKPDEWCEIKAIFSTVGGARIDSGTRVHWPVKLPDHQLKFYKAELKLGNFYLARTQHQIVGTICAIPNANKRAIMVSALAVDPFFQRMGVATLLLNHVIFNLTKTHDLPLVKLRHSTAVQHLYDLYDKFEFSHDYVEELGNSTYELFRTLDTTKRVVNSTPQPV